MERGGWHAGIQCPATQPASDGECFPTRCSIACGVANRWIHSAAPSNKAAPAAARTADHHRDVRKPRTLLPWCPAPRAARTARGSNETHRTPHRLVLGKRLTPASSGRQRAAVPAADAAPVKSSSLLSIDPARAISRRTRTQASSSIPCTPQLALPSASSDPAAVNIEWRRACLPTGLQVMCG